MVMYIHAYVANIDTYHIYVWIYSLYDSTQYRPRPVLVQALYHFQLGLQIVAVKVHVTSVL